MVSVLVFGMQEVGNSRKHAANLLDCLVRAIVMPEVKGRRPVGRFVLGYGARGAVAVDQIFVRRCLIESLKVDQR